MTSIPSPLSVALLAMVMCATFLIGSQPLAAEPSPVESDMHEFMEYVFEPAYKRLKAVMANEPADKRGWKPIKGDSLALAEACNLLFLRGPEDKRDQWNAISVAVRTQGATLYQAAKKRDYAAARKSYEAMITQCNKCHQVFADGEHQLAP